MAVCKVCNHPLQREIDIAIVEGVAYRKICELYDLSPAGLTRHKKAGHVIDEVIAEIVERDSQLPKRITKRPKQPKQTVLNKDGEELEPADSLYDRITRALEYAEKVMMRAFADKKYELVLRACRRVAETAEVAARVKMQLGIMGHEEAIPVIDTDQSRILDLWQAKQERARAM